LDEEAMSSPDPMDEGLTCPAARPVRLRRWWLVAGLAAGTLASAIFTLGFLSFAASIDQEEHPPPRKAQAMVVLTGGKDRIPDAVELLAHGYAKRLLISGVHAGLTRADVAQLAPRYHTLVECCVDLGYEARNTIGNATETRRWFIENNLQGPLLVVTSNYHMPRALVELAAVLPGVELIPAPVVTERLRRSRWWKDLHVARIWGFEYTKFLASIARTRVFGRREDRTVVAVN
jgi:uncharacterized SAM-binding protein YcdF (DUF218 family)